MTVDTVRHIWVHGAQRDTARAIMHPVLGHALGQITDGRYPLNAFHRVLYEPFEKARRLKPLLTFREFLTSDIAQALLRKLLGEDQYLLVVHRWGPDYFGARTHVLKALRTEQPHTIQWMSWGHWGADPVVVEMFDGMPRLLPVDFPVRRVAKNGTISWGYPRWETGRMRFYQNTAYAELVRRLPEGTDVPLDLSGGRLLAALAPDTDVASRPFVGMSSFRLSTWQVVQLYSTGRSPPWKADLLEPGALPEKGFRVSRGRGGRNAEDARWELARRLGDNELADDATFDAALARQKEAAEAADRPHAAATNPGHPVTQLSNAELVTLARDQPGAPRIAVKVWEVEHQRAQRSIRAIERVLYALDQVVDTSLIRHLCGLCDPHNLRLVTPEGHAALDFWAKYVGGGQRFRLNGARVETISARRGPPDDTVDKVPLDPIEEAPDDLIPPVFDPDWDSDVDVERGMNFAFGFSAYYLHPVAAMLGTPGVRDALVRFEAANNVRVIGYYNRLAGCINSAMSSYGMESSLILTLVKER